MEATILSYRVGRHTQNVNQMIIRVKDINTREKAKSLMDKKVVWKTSSGKEMQGLIKSPHGNKGALRVYFKPGLPGQSLGKKVEIQ